MYICQFYILIFPNLSVQYPALGSRYLDPSSKYFSRKFCVHTEIRSKNCILQKLAKNVTIKRESYSLTMQLLLSIFQAPRSLFLSIFKAPSSIFIYSLKQVTKHSKKTFPKYLVFSPLSHFTLSFDYSLIIDIFKFFIIFLIFIKSTT